MYHRPFQFLPVDRPLRGEVAQHAPGEAIARPRGITHHLAGISRDRHRAIRREKQGAMLTLLDNDEGGPQIENRLTRLDEVHPIGKLPSLPVVENHPGDALQGLQKGITLDLDPEVHGVARNQHRLIDLGQQLALERRVRIGKEHEAAVRK